MINWFIFHLDHLNSPINTYIRVLKIFRYHLNFDNLCNFYQNLEDLILIFRTNLNLCLYQILIVFA